MSVVFTLPEQGDLIWELLVLYGDVILCFITSNTLPREGEKMPTKVCTTLVT